MLEQKNVQLLRLITEDFGVLATGSSQKKEEWQLRTNLLDILVLLVMGTLLYYGASWQFTGSHTDLARYQCYAEAFWNGTSALNALPQSQCSFLLSSTSSTTLLQQISNAGLPHILTQIITFQSPTQPLHALPPEYPLLTVIPFSLGLVVPLGWYRIGFAISMALVTAVVYLLLKRYKSNGAAIAFAFYMVVGGWSTVLGRFDIVSAGLTLVALLLAERTKWKWAFSILALATMCKFYPIILFLPFVIAQQKQVEGKWYAWRRWSAVTLFAGVCAGLTVVSLALSIQGTLAPLTYFSNRPIQVESFSASLLWLGSFLGYPLHHVSSYGSLNVVSALSPIVGNLGTISLGLGLALVFWLQLRGRLNLWNASLLTLLIVIFTGKVFSPQYLIWVTPLIAYSCRTNWKWLLTWGSIGFLTTWIFPFIYRATPRVVEVPLIPTFYPVALVRNLLMLGVIIVFFYQALRPAPVEDFIMEEEDFFVDDQLADSLLENIRTRQPLSL